jgi:hypothetical protein
MLFGSYPYNDLDQSQAFLWKNINNDTLNTPGEMLQ